MVYQQTDALLTSAWGPLQAVTRATRTDVDIEPLRTVAVFSCLGLFASFCMAPYGLDQSKRFAAAVWTVRMEYRETHCAGQKPVRIKIARLSDNPRITAKDKFKAI
jgi:hypothetical protein